MNSKTFNNAITLYHGSQNIIETPIYGRGKAYNDFGLGFYCTEDQELAKEWACPKKQDGFLNKYSFDFSGLKVLDLSDVELNILPWLALLVKNREFDVTSQIAAQTKKKLMENYLPDISNIDVIISYRADDSYFAFAADFLNNTIPLRTLKSAMELGNLGMQIVLKSRRAFKRIEFQSYEIVDCQKYHFLRMERDRNARANYKELVRSLEYKNDDVMALNIVREEELRYRGDE